MLTSRINFDHTNQELETKISYKGLMNKNINKINLIKYIIV